jgi:hypothetical protein
MLDGIEVGARRHGPAAAGGEPPVEELPMLGIGDELAKRTHVKMLIPAP